MSEKPELPRLLNLECRFDGRPLQNSWVAVNLGMRHKNSFVLLFGASDVDGRLVVTRDELIEQAEEEIRLAPMDFRHPSDDFDGSISVRVLDRSRIQAALDAYDLWSAVSPYRSGYRESLVEAARQLEECGDGGLTVEVVAEP